MEKRQAQQVRRQLLAMRDQKRVKSKKKEEESIQKKERKESQESSMVGRFNKSLLEKFEREKANQFRHHTVTWKCYND